MRRTFAVLAVIALLLTAAACRSSVTSGPMFCGLERGMTQEQFLTGTPATCAQRFFSSHASEVVFLADSAPRPAAMQAPSATNDVAYPSPQMTYSVSPSSRPLPYETMTVGPDVWEVWAYAVSDHHREYAVFKNKQLVNWGLGQPSHAVLAHPDRVAMTN